MERSPPFDPGQVGPAAYAANYASELGARYFVPDNDWTRANGQIVRKSAMTTTIRLVKNTSGGNLTCGMIAKYAVTGVCIHVDGIAATDTPGAGVIDPFVNGGFIAANEIFFLFVGGPMPVQQNAGNTIVNGDRLVVGANGRVDEYDAAPGTDDAAQAEATNNRGVAIDSPANTDAGTAFRAHMNFDPR
jgi:hypothetical protein